MNIKLTRDALLEALTNSQGNISQVRRHLEVHGIKAEWHTVENAIHRWKETEAKYKDEKETLLDFAEDGLLQAVINKEAWAIKYSLSTRGRARGYETIPTIKIDNTDPLNINITGDAMTGEQLEKSPMVEIPEYGERTDSEE